MRIAIFGLTVTSSWGNGHATLWRGLCRALARRRHEVEFFERDVPYYASHRDLFEPEGYKVRLYEEWAAIEPDARVALAGADVGIVTSYCPDARNAATLLFDVDTTTKVFYDLDTPITLARLARGEAVPYIPAEGLRGFDLVLSYTGGRALEGLKQQLGAERTVPLYGSVDPERHAPVAPDPSRRADMFYLGTYSADRQDALQRLLIEPAERRPERRFLIGGSQYPPDFPWRANIFHVPHIAPCEHADFFCSARVTLNVTRGPMAAMGFCPSGRLFEAAACGVPVVSDWWEGLDSFFSPMSEIFVASTTEEAMAALDITEAERHQVARAARDRVLDCHTAAHRAVELEQLIEDSDRPRSIASAPRDLHGEVA